MRKYHRWVSILAAVFLLIVSATGVILQVQKLTGSDADAGERSDKEAALTSSMPASLYAELITRTVDAARTRAPNSAVASVTLKGEGDEIKGVVALPGDPPRQLVIDARSGRVLTDERRDPDSLIIRIHSGAILGEPGVVLGILWGFGLFVLSLTGGWVYLDMYRRRRKTSGKSGPFW